MEQRFRSLSLFEFQERFPDIDSCQSYLAQLKWGKGYQCRKCGHKNFGKGMSPYSRQCTSCSYTESHYGKYAFSPSKARPFESFLHPLFCKYQQKRPHLNRVEPEAFIETKDLLGFQKQSNESNKKFRESSYNR